jgi:hypothetical protein
MNPIKKIKIGFDDTEKFRNHFYPYVRGTIGRGELKKSICMSNVPGKQKEGLFGSGFCVCAWDIET